MIRYRMQGSIFYPIRWLIQATVPKYEEYDEIIIDQETGEQTTVHRELFLYNEQRKYEVCLQDEMDEICNRLDANEAEYVIEEQDVSGYLWADGLEFPDPTKVEAILEAGEKAYYQAQAEKDRNLNAEIDELQAKLREHETLNRDLMAGLVELAGTVALTARSEVKKDG